MRNWNWHQIAIWLFALVFASYMVVIPVAGMIIEKMTPMKTIQVLEEEMSLAEQMRLRSMQAMTALAFFSLGAAVGSFLNVVAYRAPRGISIAFRRSRCPSCGTQIEGRDNVPILGWLLLKGRCRACQTPISPRYPVVETVTALLILLFFFVELISGGANIPVRRPNYRAGVVWIIFYTKWDLVGLYLFHGLTTCMLLTWALIDFDRQRVPAWLRWLAGVVLGGLPIVWPNLLPVSALRKAGDFASNLPDWFSSTTVGTSVIGGLVGALFGWLVSYAVHRREPQPLSATSAAEGRSAPPCGHTASAGMIVGLTLGWQAAVGVWLLTLALQLIAQIVAGRWNRTAAPITCSLLAAYMIQLIGWRWSSVSWWPSYNTTQLGWIVVCFAFALLCLLNRLATGHRQTVVDEQPDQSLA